MAQRLGSHDRWRCWIAVQNDRPLGCIWLEFLEKVPNPGSEPEEHAYVTALYVEPDKRRIGTGCELLAKAIAECRRRGVDCALLWSTPESRDVYLEHGFATDVEVLVLRDVAGPSPTRVPVAGRRPAKRSCEPVEALPCGTCAS